jgi:hypothetical protein
VGAFDLVAERQPTWVHLVEIRRYYTREAFGEEGGPAPQYGHVNRFNSKEGYGFIGLESGAEAIFDRDDIMSPQSMREPHARIQASGCDVTSSLQIEAPELLMCGGRSRLTGRIALRRPLVTATLYRRIVDTSKTALDDVRVRSEDGARGDVEYYSPVAIR